MSYVSSLCELARNSDSGAGCCRVLYRCVGVLHVCEGSKSGTGMVRFVMRLKDSFGEAVEYLLLAARYKCCLRAHCPYIPASTKHARNTADFQSPSLSSDSWPSV